MIKVFYNEKQSTAANDDSFSPSAQKPQELVSHWQKLGKDIEVVSDFEPVTREQLCRAHLPAHVDAVLACKKDNGFYNRLPEVAETLPWTSGSMLAAAVYAWKNKTVTMSPTSGFHHAKQDECMGFCSFNGLMVAALELLEQGAAKIGILDLDHHFGNGTASIIDWLDSQGHKERSHFHHYTFGGDLRVCEPAGFFGGRTTYNWQGGDATDRWFKLLPSILEEFRGCDIVLYQAGADPHIDDPCHELLKTVGALTSEQLAIRDRMVFEAFAEMDIPVAWNLAGGYQKPISKVLDIHTATLDNMPGDCL